MRVCLGAIDDENDDDTLDRRCTDSDSKKRRLNTRELESDAPEDESETGDYDGDGAELTIGERSFKPLYFVSQWEEPGTKTKHVTVAIALPSGVGIGEFN